MVLVLAVLAVVGCQPTPSSGPASSELSESYAVRPAPAATPTTGAPTTAAPTTSAPTTSPATTAAPTTTTPAVQATASSVWTTPVSQLNPGDPRWSQRLCAYGDVWSSCGAKWATEMLGGTGDDYGIPVYDTSTASTELLVRRKNPNQWPGLFTVGSGQRVPWNPTSWRPSSGRDSYMVVRDSSTGQEWGFWNVSWWNHQTDQTNNIPCDPWLSGNGLNLPAPFGAGWDGSSMLCAASAFQVKDPQGRPVDTRTWKGNMPGASGGGWHLGPLVVTPDEVASGRVGHALHFVSSNTMSGPECAPSQRSGLGTTCAGAVAPAGQFELIGTNADLAALARAVPEGARFSIDVTDAEIESWLNSRGYTGTLRTTARTIAVALRDYGWFLGDSSPTSSAWVFDSSPAARTKWRAMGVPGDGKALLQGLVNAGNLRSWAPPTQTCADGSTSTWYCWAVDAKY